MTRAVSGFAGSMIQFARATRRSASGASAGRAKEPNDPAKTLRLAGATTSSARADRRGRGAWSALSAARTGRHRPSAGPRERRARLRARGEAVPHGSGFFGLGGIKPGEFVGDGVGGGSPDRSAAFRGSHGLPRAVRVLGHFDAVTGREAVAVFALAVRGPGDAVDGRGRLQLDHDPALAWRAGDPRSAVAVLAVIDVGELVGGIVGKIARGRRFAAEGDIPFAGPDFEFIKAGLAAAAGPDRETHETRLDRSEGLLVALRVHGARRRGWPRSLPHPATRGRRR